MGYTHYWEQTAPFTAEEWDDVSRDVYAIVDRARSRIANRVKLGGPDRDRGSKPLFSASEIAFNGVGDDGHESFQIFRDSGDEFCKTARKPYDVVVTACLCYLSSVTGKYHVTSDGHGDDFLAGLELAKEALPNLANQLDLPMGVMENDRWVGPYISGYGDTGYDVNCCVNGKAYVIQNKSGASYMFDTHADLARFLEANKLAKFRKGGSAGWFGYDKNEPNIWNASGSFDKARHDRIAKAQAKVLKTLFPVPPERAEQPPAYVRPGQYDREAFRAYYLRDVLTPQAEAAE